MTNKQKNRIANELVHWELIHYNKEATSAQIKEAERKIIAISNQLMCLPNGLELMSEIDIIMQKKLEKLKVI